MHSFSMRPAKYFYDKPLLKYLDPKTVLIYRPHPVGVADANFSILDPGSGVEKIPDPGSESTNISIFNPKNCF